MKLHLWKHRSTVTRRTGCVTGDATCDGYMATESESMPLAVNRLVSRLSGLKDVTTVRVFGVEYLGRVEIDAGDADDEMGKLRS